MATFQRACLLIASAILLSGCAAAQFGSTDLASVCAVPVNRTVQSMYWLDCLSLNSPSHRYSKHY